MKFQWQLLAVQRKQEWDLDLARSRLATLLAAGAEVAALLRTMQGRHAEHAAHAAAHPGLPCNPQLHAHAMAYLCGVEEGIAQAHAQQQRLQQEIAAARAECLRCRQRLDTMERLHAQALAGHLQEERRAEAKAADLAWLARPGACAVLPEDSA